MAGVAPGGFLTHLLPVVPQALGNGLSENALVYYDIFVRHAFTNYRDVMKEVSHSYAMGTMLSFKDARSFKSSGFYPDENYAREIMQLFTMGLWHLHDNGTKVLDAKGQPIATYVQDDVVNFARAWTGFVAHPERANLEIRRLFPAHNTIDPLKLRMSRRDTFPRTDLVGGQYCRSPSPSSPAPSPHHNKLWVWRFVRSAGTGPSSTRNSFAATVIYVLTAASFPICCALPGYVGDGQPLCEDLPKRAFLRQGATYEYVGPTPIPRKSHLIHSGYGKTDPYLVWLELNRTNSGLYKALCDPGTNGGACRFKSVLNLPATVECAGKECSVDTAVLVKLRYFATPSPAPNAYAPGCSAHPHYAPSFLAHGRPVYLRWPVCPCALKNCRFLSVLSGHLQRSGCL